MDRVAVESSCVTSIGYDRDAKILEIEFIDGPVYRYFGVPQLEHRRLLSADSIGTYVNQIIKRRYRYAKVEDHGSSSTSRAEGSEKVVEPELLEQDVAESVASAGESCRGLA